MNITDIRDSLVLKGAEKLALAVSSTIGPKGHNVLLDKGYAIITMTNDCYEITKVINLPDQDENKGARLLTEVARQTYEGVGDGCCAAVLMAQSIIAEGVKNIQAGANPVLIRNGLNKALEVCTDYLQSRAKETKSQDILLAVAQTAAKDDELVNEIKAAFSELGHGKIVTIEESPDSLTRLEKTAGMLIDNGYVSPYFVKEKDCSDIELENSYVLISDKVISDFEDLIPVIELVEEKSASLLILSAGVVGEALSNLLLNVYKRGLKAVAVIGGGYGISGREILEDAAVYTGGKVIDSYEWDYRKSDLTYLGMAKNVKVSQNKTIITGGMGSFSSVNEYILALNRYCNECDDKTKRIAFRTRIARLSDERIIIKVGAETIPELQEKKKKCEKAVAAVHSAYNTGVLAGGGVAYIRCIPELKLLAETLEGDERTGAGLLMKALETPTYNIVKNAGFSGEKITEDIKTMDPETGFDVNNVYYCNMSEQGILDACGVLTEALNNAVSIASVFLTASSFVSKNKVKNKMVEG